MIISLHLRTIHNAGKEHLNEAPPYLFARAGSPALPSSLLRYQLFDNLLGYTHMGLVKNAIKDHGLKHRSVPIPAWNQHALILPIEDWPGRIRGFYCILKTIDFPIMFNGYKPRRKPVVYLSKAPNNRFHHFPTIEEGLELAKQTAMLKIRMNITTDPILNT